MKYELIKKEERGERITFNKLADVLWNIVKEGDLDEEFIIYESTGKRLLNIYLVKNQGHRILIEAW